MTGARHIGPIWGLPRSIFRQEASLYLIADCHAGVCQCARPAEALGICRQDLIFKLSILPSGANPLPAFWTLHVAWEITFALRCFLSALLSRGSLCARVSVKALQNLSLAEQEGH